MYWGEIQIHLILRANTANKLVYVVHTCIRGEKKLLYMQFLRVLVFVMLTGVNLSYTRAYTNHVYLSAWMYVFACVCVRSHAQIRTHTVYVILYTCAYYSMQQAYM